MMGESLDPSHNQDLIFLAAVHACRKRQSLAKRVHSLSKQDRKRGKTAEEETRNNLFSRSRERPEFDPSIAPTSRSLFITKIILICVLCTCYAKKSHIEGAQKFGTLLYFAL